MIKLPILLFALSLPVLTSAATGTYSPAASSIQNPAGKACDSVIQASDGKSSVRGTFTAGDGYFLLNGEPFVIKAAELHYPRIPREYWEHRIQMCKALGMNTICLYVFWNIHEQREGEFDFSGQNDLAAFCRLAQENDMYVIVRPGPYVCAEWEMGGLPWWLLKKKDIRLRESDPWFMERVELFMRQVGTRLAPLTIANGGPIIMVQVENEYGSYGADKEYVAGIRDILRRSGFNDVTLFQCDWASNFTLNGLDDLVWTMNFGTGSDIDAQFRRLRELRPDSPLMCSEFWSGWFDKWGAAHETRPGEAMAAGIDEMLSKGISFSLYMTHGGTSFGHWAGANSPGFAPDVTSYDYDAPVNEYGQPTEKYYLLREVLQKYSDTPLPRVPDSPAKIIEIPRFTLDEYVPLVFGADSSFSARKALTFEEMDMGWGTAVYSSALPECPEGSVLCLEGAHDYAMVYINGKYTGKTDRVLNETTLVLPPTRQGDVLSIVVEGMGRINFGRAIKDFKGLTGEVSLNATIDGHEFSRELRDWEMLRIPDGYEDALRAFEYEGSGDAVLDSGAGYYRGRFNLKKTGDTFIDMESWGKGQVYVNGYPIGRFWSIGPQQTLYVPGCWLREGENEIIVLDVAGPDEAAVCGKGSPELDRLNLEESGRHNRPGDRPDLNSATPAASGRLPALRQWQSINFTSIAEGRYLAIQCSGAGEKVSIAEIYALDPDGNRIAREDWQVKYADSEDMENGNHSGDKAFDLQESTWWSTTAGAPAPHLLVIDMGSVQRVSTLEYLPRTTGDGSDAIDDYAIYLF